MSKTKSTLAATFLTLVLAVPSWAGIMDSPGGSLPPPPPPSVNQWGKHARSQARGRRPEFIRAGRHPHSCNLSVLNDAQLGTNG